VSSQPNTVEAEQKGHRSFVITKDRNYIHKQPILDDYSNTELMKHGSVSSLKNREGRPKTNQSAKRVFGQGQVSLDQGNPQQRMETKNYSLTMSGQPISVKSNYMQDFKTTSLKQFSEMHEVLPESPAVK
jgi:hypothetical protein